MKKEVREEILYDIKKASEILQEKEAHDLEELQELSNHAIEDVAVHKDLDLIAMTVLLYSIYKVATLLKKEDYALLKKYLDLASHHMGTNDYGRYNSNMKRMFELVKSCNAKVKKHLQDVLHAARIKKGTVLLEKGLSIGQAAGLMGLSNWDLQAYAGKTTAFGQHTEKFPARDRMMRALKIFGVE